MSKKRMWYGLWLPNGYWFSSGKVCQTPDVGHRYTNARFFNTLKAANRTLDQCPVGSTLERFIEFGGKQPRRFSLRKWVKVS